MVVAHTEQHSRNIVVEVAMIVWLPFIGCTLSRCDRNKRISIFSLVNYETYSKTILLNDSVTFHMSCSIHRYSYWYPRCLMTILPICCEKHYEENNGKYEGMHSSFSAFDRYEICCMEPPIYSLRFFFSWRKEIQQKSSSYPFIPSVSLKWKTD